MNSHQESLVTPLRLQDQESLELSQVILQLATANQRLATAHGAALSQLERLYVELQKERASRTAVNQSFARVNANSATPPVAAPRRRTTGSQGAREEHKAIEEMGEKLESRLDRLEVLLSQSFSVVWQNSQENSQEMKERTTKWQEALPDIQKCVKYCAQTGESSDWTDARRNEFEEAKETFDPPRCSSSLESEGTKQEMKRRCKAENSEDERSTRLANEETIKLLEEIDRLKADKTEYQKINERLLANLAEQKKFTEKLSQDYEMSKAQCENFERTLNELRRDYEFASNERRRLLKEIASFQLERDTAEARITNLEEDLQRSMLENEETRKLEGQNVTKLRAQLSHELSERKRQTEALEDALEEIRRLKECMKKTEMTNNNINNNNNSSSNNNNNEGSSCKAETADDCSSQTSELSECSCAERATANMENFKKDLILKREARQRAIAAVSSEMERIKRELEAEREAHSETSRVLNLLRSAAQIDLQNGERGAARKGKGNEEKSNEDEVLSKRIEIQRLQSVLKVSDELRNNIRFQVEKVDDLRYQLENEPEQHRYIVRCLSEITSKTRDNLSNRERRTNELKDYLARNLARLSDRSLLDLKDDVSAECERQLESISSLKSLYNERLKVLSELRDAAVKELAETKEKLKHALKDRENLEEDLKKAEEKIDVQDTEISNLESQLGLTKADCRDLQNQMSLINSLFTQMLLGASSADIDLDRLTELLHENRDLICDIARNDGTEAAALPKLLLDLMEQVDGSKGSQKRNADDSDNGEPHKREEDQHHEDIAHNLPKVWRVLLELLSCHAASTPNPSTTASSSDSNSCYKSVDTPSGPKLVISVSKTYIHLKELILEKKHLEKEMNRMKQLNVHLESKLGEQEKRLSEVTAELSKTWNIVGRMQAQHQQLHTHEKILRYELQQKRKMLQELKMELEYCREKWESARQKNTNTELEWRSLRREFAARKMMSAHGSVNNSAESGFSDGRGDDSDDEEDRVRMGPPKRNKKENPRMTAADVESEQPTDTELSESKGSSSLTLEARSPSPEIEVDMCNSEVLDASLPVDSVNAQETDFTSEMSEPALDPLDEALTSVIRNLIRIDDEVEFNDEEFASRESIAMPFDCENNSEENDNENENENENKNEYRGNENENDNRNENKDEDRENGNETEELPTKEEDLTENSHNVQTNNDFCCILAGTEQTEASDNCGNKLTTPSTTQNNEEDTGESTKISTDCTEMNRSCTTPVFSIGPIPPCNSNIDPSKRIFSPIFNAPCNVNPLELLNNEAKESSKAADATEEPEEPEEAASPKNQRKAERNGESLDSWPSADWKRTPEGTSKSESTSTPEQVLSAREDRLKRLEEQADWLMKKMNATSRRGSALSTRLEALHETYGEASSTSNGDASQRRNSKSASSEATFQVTENSSDGTTERKERRESSPSSKDETPR